MRDVKLGSQREQLESEVEEFTQKVSEKLDRLGIKSIIKPETKEVLLSQPRDISNVSDQDIGRLYFAAQQWAAYISVCASRADAEATLAHTYKDRAYSRALSASEGSAAEDRKAEALLAPLHQEWNMVYLEKRALYRELQSISLSHERMAEAYSREMTRRKLEWDKASGSHGN
jgi:hypothetical protein